MDWDDLRVFLAVAREGSISGGARRLGVQHSTVSRRLRLIEAELGTELLERRTKGLELSPAGQELRESAERVEAEVLGFESRIGGLDSLEAGEVRVSTTGLLANSLLMPMIVKFSQEFPNIRLKLDVSNDYVSLSNRDADVAIRLTNEPPPNLIGVRLGTMASAVYARKSQRGTPNEWVGVECCDIHIGWTRDACQTSGKNLVVNDTLLTLAAVKQGAGLAYLPCFLADPEPDIIRHAPPEERHDLGVWLLYHKDLSGVRRVGSLRKFMLREFELAKPELVGRSSPC